MAKKHKLSVLSSTATIDTPPPSLGAAGVSLWRAVMSEYAISDIGGLTMLEQACVSLDRAEDLRAQIERDGSVLRGAQGTIKEHPGLKHELQCRAFAVKTLRALGLDVEPVRAVGRPGGGLGWTP